MLLRRRERKLTRLRELAEKMLIGSSSETYRTCGTPTCHCHTTGPKHGPHVYVNYKGEHGRTTGYYVPKALHETVRDGLSSWKKFQALAKEIGHLNKEIMDARRGKKGKQPARR